MKIKFSLILIVFLLFSSQAVHAQTATVKFSFNILLHGIGNGGDNVTAGTGGNKNPLTPNRILQVELYNSSDQLVSTKQGTITYNTAGGNFTGTVDMGTVQSGAYLVKIKTNKYLRKAIPGIITIASGQTVQIPQVAMVVGDSNNDNKINILDYNSLLDCFSDLLPPKNCSDPAKKSSTDLTDDGKVDQIDYNLLLREVSVQVGDGGGTGGNPTPTMHMGGGGAGTNSMAMGKWTPNAKYDTCTKEQHDAYKVQGPDGKWYPTWHPPLGPGGCKFGHEHGRDPSGYQYWNEIKQHFAYNGNLTNAGIPFGYVNEQIDASGLGFMRHEDHVGHKIEFANGEGDIGDGTDPFDSNTTGGVVVPVKNSSGGTKWSQSGVRCYHFHKVHQGVSTPDALTNNIHEVIMHTKCTSTRNDFPASTSLLSGMIAFGASGEFTGFCGDNRNTVIALGKTDANRNWPGTRDDGVRNIITRECVEQTVLVPDGQFSAFPYEIWSGELRIRNASGTVIAQNGGGWEVLDAIRYYNPGSANKISYTASWCYEVLGNRKARGGTCDFMTNYGKITDITFDDPRSEFRGVHRGQYINAHRLQNNGGAQVWYSDPFGRNAKTTPFAGSVKQLISPVNADLVGKVAFDPRIVQRRHNDGNNSVHAPN